MTEYICNNLWQLWAAVAVICLIIELFTVGFFIFCFSIGAIAALIVSFLFGIYAQMAVFIIVSAICIFLVKPFALRFFHPKDSECRTNADALTGCYGVVSQTIKEGGYGRVAVGGDDWKAESESGESIEEGVRVKVVGRESIIIKVTKYL